MSGETARTDADELARIIAIVGHRHWSRGEEHDATDIAERIAELAQRELERLTVTPVGPVTEHLRSRVAEVCQAALDGKAGCIGVACIAPHQAGELLDAYDDARRELADEQAFHAKTADNFEVVAAGWSEEFERLTRELHERQRECALARARDGLQRFGADKAIEARAREIAEAAGWSCYSAKGEQP